MERLVKRYMFCLRRVKKYFYKYKRKRRRSQFINNIVQINRSKPSASRSGFIGRFTKRTHSIKNIVGKLIDVRQRKMLQC